MLAARLFPTVVIVGAALVASVTIGCSADDGEPASTIEGQTPAPQRHGLLDSGKVTASRGRLHA